MPRLMKYLDIALVQFPALVLGSSLIIEALLLLD